MHLHADVAPSWHATAVDFVLKFLSYVSLLFFSFFLFLCLFFPPMDVRPLNLYCDWVIQSWRRLVCDG